MKKHNQNGFSVIEGLLILIIVILIGVVGWFVWDRQHNSSVASTKTLTSSSAHQAAPSAKIDNYAECVKAEGSKTVKVNTDYWSTCTTNDGVSFVPLDPSNFSKVGEKISLDFPDPTLPCDGVPDNSMTHATLVSKVNDWAKVTWQANCGDALQFVYNKTATGWHKVLSGHLLLYTCAEINKYKIPRGIIAQCFPTDNVDLSSDSVDNPNQ